LGSPLGLLSNIGSGFKDFFEEPAKAIRHDPSQIGLGMAKGTAKLVGKTVFTSVFGTTSKITGVVSNVTAQASFDKEYLAQRNIDAQSKPKHVGEGFAMGLMGFGKGLVGGVTGIVTQPMKGVKEEGAVGLMKGIGKGLVGLAVKPSVAAIDLVTKSTEGIANTTAYLERDKRRTKRPTRYFDERCLVMVYNREKASGQHLLHTLNQGEFKNQIYYFHICLDKGDKKKTTVLISKSAFFLIHKPVINFGNTGYQIQFSFLLTCTYITYIRHQNH